jgi:hypothetical protein
MLKNLRYPCRRNTLQGCVYRIVWCCLLTQTQLALGVVTWLVRRIAQIVDYGNLIMGRITVVFLAEAQRDPIASVSTTQSSPIASAKSHSRKLKPSAAHNGTTPSNSSLTVPNVSSPPPFQALRPFRRYSRRALVALAKSPLVAPPPGMPALKDWFGCVVFIHAAPLASYLFTK